MTVYGIRLTDGDLHREVRRPGVPAIYANKFYARRAARKVRDRHAQVVKLLLVVEL